MTWALTITGVVKPLMAVGYVLAQLTGAIAGAALLYSSTEDVAGSCNTTTSTTAGKAFGREAILTFLLVTTVMATLDPEHDRREDRVVVPRVQ